MSLQMKHNALILLAALLLCCTAAAQTQLRDVATKLAKEMVADADIAKLKGEKLFIAEFENINGKGDAVPRIFQEMLTTAFIKEKHFKVVERAQLEKALKELKISSTGLVDPDNAKKIGKMLGAAYMVVGSISDLSGSVSIDTRVVSIESGESITAADATIQNSSVSSAPIPNANQKVDLAQQANSDKAGQMLGPAENMGLLGGAGFGIAWREKLDSGFAYAFTAGSIVGDSSSRLGLLEEDPHYADLEGWTRLVVFRWMEGTFRRVWTDGALFTDDLPQHIGVLRVPPMQCIEASTQYQQSVWRWDGSTYQRIDRKVQEGTTQFKLVTHISYEAADTVLAGISFGGPFYARLESDASDPFAWTESAKQISRSCDWTGSCVFADLDADKKSEVAVVGRPLSNCEPIEIISLDGKRKGVTTGAYDCRLTVWQPGNLRAPYLVAKKDSKDESGKPNGGYLYLIQWNGETYDEVWKSNRMDDYIQDIQVCDPKGEGQDGLVVLSGDRKNNMYLTKIVAE